MTDARFEDAHERPLRLLAQDGDDLKVLSALVQDAVLTARDLKYSARNRRFSLLLNRFRWEDRAQARAAGRAYERVRAVLDFADVVRVTHQGLDRSDPDTVFSLLSVEFAPDADPAGDGPEGDGPAGDGPAGDGPAGDGPAGPGRILLTFAGDGAIALQVECLQVQLADVTRPYVAPSRRAPDHGPD